MVHSNGLQPCVVNGASGVAGRRLTVASHPGVLMGKFPLVHRKGWAPWLSTSTIKDSVALARTSAACLRPHANPKSWPSCSYLATKLDVTAMRYYTAVVVSTSTLPDLIFLAPINFVTAIMFTRYRTNTLRNVAGIALVFCRCCFCRCDKFNVV